MKQLASPKATVVERGQVLSCFCFSLFQEPLNGTYLAKTVSPSWLSWRCQADICRGQRARTGEGLLSLNLTSGCYLSSKSHKVEASTSACSKKTATGFFVHQCPFQLYVTCSLVSILSLFPCYHCLFCVSSPCLHYYLLHIPFRKLFQSYSANQFDISEQWPCLWDMLWLWKYIPRCSKLGHLHSGTWGGISTLQKGQAIELLILKTPNSKQLLTLWSLSSAVFECICFHHID